MEGVSGLFTREQVWFWEEGTRADIAAQGQRLLIDDVNALSAAALDAGVDELIVSDTHHGGNNIALDQMLDDPRITYHPRSVGREGTRRRWLPGLDESVDGLMLPGHHSRAGTEAAFLPHTWTGEWSDFSINGQSVGEIGIEACYAGHWDVPLILATGDDATEREVADQFPQAAMARVKRATGSDLCSGPDPGSAHELIAEQVAEAVARVRSGAVAPYKPALPMTVSVRMKTAEQASVAAARPGVERADEYTIQARVDQQCDVVKWILGTGLNMPPKEQ